MIKKTLAAVLCLLLIACSQSQVISALDTAVAAATTAFPIIAAATGLPPAQVTTIMAYLHDANTALGKVAATLAAGGTPAEIAGGIAADLAGVAASEPSLAGLPAAVASVIQAVATDIATLLTQYGAKPATAMLSLKQWHPNASEQAKIATIHGRARANLEKIAAWRAAK